VREQGSEGSNIISASADCGKLPSKPKINPSGEVKAITLRDDPSDSEFPVMQEVKRTLRNGTLYQGTTIPTNLEVENMREAQDERLENPEGLIVEEIPYEKEIEHAKPTNSIMLASMSEPSRKSMNTKKSYSYTAHAQFTRPICIDYNPRKKKKKRT
jgi:hypothetical protein